MFTDTYRYGYEVNYRNDLPDNEIVKALAESRAEFHYCTECNDGSIVILSIGTYGGDILDYANAKAVENIHDDYSPDTYMHNGYSTTLCIDPTNDIDLDVIESLIDIAESFEDYPVLDEDIYSAMEFEAFEESFEEGTQDMSDDIANIFVAELPEIVDDSEEYLNIQGIARRIASENYYGYSDPGYISPEHVLESWKAAVAAYIENLQAKAGQVTLDMPN